MTKPTLSLIAAVARDGGIGRGNELLWREKADQQHFRRLTMGHPVIMGRRTWDSLNPRFKPLPGRRNLVLTRDPDWRAEGAEALPSLDAALAATAGAGTVFVIGGAQLYVAALPIADELQLTEVGWVIDGADTFFPAWPREAFEEVSRDDRHDGEGRPYAFVHYRRRPA